MATTERKDLVDAVLKSRDEVDPGLDTELLESIVDAEANAMGDGEAAMRAIDAAVTAAIGRGVGRLEDMTEPERDDDGDEEQEGEA